MLEEGDSEKVRKIDTPTPRYDPSALVGSMFRISSEVDAQQLWDRFSPKEVKNTIKGIIYQQAASDILADMVTPSEEGKEPRFIPVEIIDDEERMVRKFKKREDVLTDGKADFAKIQWYIVGLFRTYADKGFASLEAAHPQVAALYRESERRLGSDPKHRFSALDLGIETIAAFVNSSRIEAEGKGRPDPLTILGNSMPALVSIARESIETKGNPDDLGMFGLKEDPKQVAEATARYEDAFMQLSTHDAITLFVTSVNATEREWNAESRTEYRSRVQELIHAIHSMDRTGAKSLSELGRANEHIKLRLKDYLSPHTGEYYLLRGVVNNHAASYGNLKRAMDEIMHAQGFRARAPKILSPEYFTYDETAKGLAHKRTPEGHPEYFRREYRYGGIVGDIEPKEKTTGCSGLMFNLKAETPEEKAYWARFPKIPRNPIGLATTIAYLYSES